LRRLSRPSPGRIGTAGEAARGTTSTGSLSLLTRRSCWCRSSLDCRHWHESAQHIDTSQTYL
jgi:hypothetical protein